MTQGTLATVIRVLDFHDVIAWLRERVFSHRITILRERFGIAVRLYIHRRRAVAEVPCLPAVIAKGAHLEGDGIARLDVGRGGEAGMNRRRNVLHIITDHLDDGEIVTHVAGVIG
jgi:hypothetical protein